MKLLIPSQNHQKEEEEVARLILRTTDAQEENKRINQKLAQSVKEFDETMQRQRDEFAAEMRDHQQKILAAKSELESVIDKTKRAMEPIEDIKRRTEQELQDAINKNKELVRRQEEVEEQAEILQDRLDYVGYREQNIKNAEEKNESDRKKIEIQQTYVDQMTERLNTNIAKASQDAQKRENELNERAIALQIEKSNIQAREFQLSKMEQSLQQFAGELRSERDALQSAWNELRRTKERK